MRRSIKSQADGMSYWGRCDEYFTDGHFAPCEGCMLTEPPLLQRSISTNCRHPINCIRWYRTQGFLAAGGGDCGGPGQFAPLPQVLREHLTESWHTRALLCRGATGPPVSE
jgi:hypothetical protein